MGKPQRNTQFVVFRLRRTAYFDRKDEIIEKNECFRKQADLIYAKDQLY